MIPGQWLVNGVIANAYTYDQDDRLGCDQYDSNGNTILSGGWPRLLILRV